MKVVSFTLVDIKRIKSMLLDGQSLSSSDMQVVCAVLDLTIKQYEDPEFSLGSELSNAVLEGKKNVDVKIRT